MSLTIRPRTPMTPRHFPFALPCLLVLAACSGGGDAEPSPPEGDASLADATSNQDAGTSEAGSRADGAPADSGTGDDASVASDARSSSDASTATDGTADVPVVRKALGAACTSAPECASGSCVDGVCCNVACGGLCEACVASKTGGTDGTCRSVTVDTDPDAECASDPTLCKAGTCDGAGACKAASDGTECRPSAGECDVAETCAGGACPVDAVKGATTECRASGGECDVAEKCDGTSSACPPDLKAPDTTECRGSAGVCDVPERCDGTTNACPSDAFASGNTCGVTFVCKGASASCPTTCASDADCDENAMCVMQHVCVPGRRAFTTSATYAGNLGGIFGADQKCQALATAANFRGTYKAWISDSVNAVAVRLTRSPLPYVMQNGVSIANDWADIIDGSLRATFQVDETGATVPSNIPWTGTLGNGTASAANCSNWTSSANIGVQGGYGSSTVFTSGWTYTGDGFCNVVHRLYCLQQ
ncbi:MAG: DUF1554 domain-containing protein [Polyangiaceae bacterium]